MINNYKLKKLGGSFASEYNNKCYNQCLELLNLNGIINPSFSKYIYIINGTEYTNIHEIPLEILKEHHILSEHIFRNTSSQDELTTFILFRLTDKLKYKNQSLEFGITNYSDIIELILNNEFIELFKEFLVKQSEAGIIPGVSSLILDSFRDEHKVLSNIFKFGSPLRTLNDIYVKQITSDADLLWKRLTEYSRNLLNRQNRQN